MLDAPSLPFLVSGSSERALRAQAESLVSHLEHRSELELEAAAATLALGRAQLSHRAAVLAGDRDQLIARLRALSAGEPKQGVIEGLARGERRVAFVFPGQGGQWPGMALELLDRSPVFAESMQACARPSSPHLDWSAGGRLARRARAPRRSRPVEVVQPALFAVMVSLARLWRSFGVEPSAVVGHSQGEIAAAHVAGGLSLSDAALIVAARSRALATIEGKGGMLALALSPEQFEERARGLGERVTLAAVNGPASVVCLRRSRGARRARALLRGRRGAGRPDPGELREPLPPGRGGPRAAALSPRRDRATPQRAPPLLHRHRRARRHSPDGRRALVRQPAPDGALRAGDRGDGQGGYRRPDRGRTPSDPALASLADARLDRERRHGRDDRIPAPRRGRVGAIPDIARRGAHMRSPDRLGITLCGRRARRAAHLRLPARALLVAAHPCRTRTCTAARSARTGTVSSSKSTGARSRGRRTDRGGGWPSSETAHRRPPSVPPSSGTPTSRR